MPRWLPKSDADYISHLKSRTVEAANGCWEWTGHYGKTSKGRYGEAGYRGGKYRVHRLMYRLTKGPTPAGLVVRHKCDNSICINPDHLELGTQFQNCQDATVKGRYWHHESRFTACKHGHEFTPENTWVCSQGFRHCRTCAKLRMNTPEYKAQANERQRRNRAMKRAQRLQLSEGPQRG